MGYMANAKLGFATPDQLRSELPIPVDVKPVDCPRLVVMSTNDVLASYLLV
jgi:hypothetical protein